MATLVVAILCIALVIFGGVTLSQGMLNSADVTAVSVEGISTRESQITRTSVDTLRVEVLPWDDALRVRVRNDGLDKLASYGKWDVIVRYYDAGNDYYATWLPYTTGAPAANEWTAADIWHGGPNEFFEPAILNPQEELVIVAQLAPQPTAGSTPDVTVVTPVGVFDSLAYDQPSNDMLVPHAETFSIGADEYFDLLGGVAGDGSAMTETTDTISRHDVGRWLLHDQYDSSQDARHLFSLTGLDSIPAGTWTFTYRGRADGGWYGGSHASLNVDIIIRRADGTVRQTIASGVADAVLDDFDHWETVTAVYGFPGYTVVDDTDLLEIAYYGQSSGVGPSDYQNRISLRIDDPSLTLSNQTRIEP